MIVNESADWGKENEINISPDNIEVNRFPDFYPLPHYLIYCWIRALDLKTCGGQYLCFIRVHLHP